MKIDVRSDQSIDIVHGDYTYYLDFSVEGQTSCLRFRTDDDEIEAPMIIWKDGSDAMEIF